MPPDSMGLNIKCRDKNLEWWQQESWPGVDLLQVDKCFVVLKLRAGVLCKVSLKSGSQMFSSAMFWLTLKWQFFIAPLKACDSQLLSLQDRGPVKANPSGWSSFLWEAPQQAAILTHPVSRRASAADLDAGQWGSAAEDLCPWKWACCPQSSDCQDRDPPGTAEPQCRSVSPPVVSQQMRAGGGGNTTHLGKKLYIYIIYIFVGSVSLVVSDSATPWTVAL